MFEIPPRPTGEEEINTENMPKKRNRESDIMEMVLSCDIRKYEEEHAMQSGDFSRIGEIERMKEHATE